MKQQLSKLFNSVLLVIYNVYSLIAETIILKEIVVIIVKIPKEIINSISVKAFVFFILSTS